MGDLITESEEPVPDALLLLGRAYHCLGEHPRAVAAFKDYLRLRPRSAAGYLFAGRSYLALGMPDRAFPLLKKAHNLVPKDTRILALLGVASLKARRSAQAVECLQAAVELAPEDRRIYRAYLNALLVRGVKLCRSGGAEVGAQMLRFVVENGLNAPLPHLELMRCYRDRGDHAAALRHCEEAVALSPEDPSLRWYRAAELMALGRGLEAQTELDGLRAAGADLPEAAWNQDLVEFFMARNFLAEGSWRKAAEACGSLLRRRKNDPVVHAMYAEALRNLGDGDAARNHLDRAAEAGGDQAALRYARIIMAWQEGDHQDLARNLAALERLGGDPILIRRFRALLASTTDGDDTVAVQLLQNAIRESGPIPELMHALAGHYLKLGLPELAEPWYRKTRTVEAGREEAYLGEIAAAEALATEGDTKAHSRLRSLYPIYLDRWGDNRTIRREWALFLVKDEAHGRAAAELELLLAWDSGNASLRRVLAYSYRKTGRYRDAAMLLKRLLKEDPKNIGLLLEFTGCLERSGASALAAEVLRKALPLFRKSAVPRLALGDMLYRERRIEAALDAYREAASADGRDPRPYRRMASIYRATGAEEQATRYEREAKMREKA